VAGERVDPRPPGGRDGRWTGPAVASLSEVIALLPDANP